MHPIIDAPNGGKLWLGGAAAAKNPNFLIEIKIAVVWPANRTAGPSDTAAVRVLQYLDGTGCVHGEPPLEVVLDRVDEVLSLLNKGFNILIACHNGAHRSATLTPGSRWRVRKGSSKLLGVHDSCWLLMLKRSKWSWQLPYEWVVIYCDSKRSLPKASTIRLIL